MKKLLLVAMMAFGMAVNAQETELNVGGTIGLPTGDASDNFDVTGAIEANYLFKVAEDIKVGPSVSYLHFKGDGADIAFIPVSVAGRYAISEKFSVGADLGYGIGVRPSGATESGFYYRPIVGYKVTDKITVHVDYSSVKLDNGTGSTFGLGGTYSFSL
ncbi:MULTISPECIES: outer membrane beta-barrel protein [unclassified Tenacibaculum]|uniref:outer membrane beta-barrel protein n=1 Tax=unclassified Tenacibaculum TaxID=2635139 RepID=UPI001F1C4C50|nr:MULTISPECIES: outer membrane beta-barrel protein [unclassified Tenacibaculum]MCF2875649.1 outer membrane beta-barrel protein [Tenacibaculum sp. Cn5-1]MCF2935725.1 outer membrane beta-barrel protein [Tenacibaculum sp. Cn5-34]MCG7512285.1 outer membrane beta-barrel protein [Tenacibaculum sp. Cn5-46]